MDPQNGQDMDAALPNEGIQYENYNDAAVSSASEEKTTGANIKGVPVNVINAVNANGIVSGRKVVDESWQRIAICLMVLAGGLLIGLVVAILFARSLDDKVGDLQTDYAQQVARNESLNKLIGAETFEDALDYLNDGDILKGGDLEKINNLVIDHRKVGYVLNFEDSNLSFINHTGSYKFISLVLSNGTNAFRVVAYSNIGDGEWHLSNFDANDAEYPCRNSSDEERKILKRIELCTEDYENMPSEEEMKNATEEKPEDKNTGGEEVGE